jgi:hypothetical protein
MPKFPNLPKPKNGSATRRNEQLILALLQHPTIERAATSAGVSESTLRRRMHDPEFQELYRVGRREFYSQAVARLQHASSAAVGTLLRVMTDPGSPAASRVRAAWYVLDQATRFMETEDLELRLARLEAEKHKPSRRGRE